MTSDWVICDWGSPLLHFRARRAWLAAHLSQTTNEGTLYIFGGLPGLHFGDIARLSTHRAPVSGILIIEHNLKVIAARLGDRPGPEAATAHHR